MKHQNWALLLFVFFFTGSIVNTSNAQNTTVYPTNIHLQIAGLNSGRVYLTGVYKNVQSTIDSAQIEAGGDIYFRREKALETGEYAAILPGGAELQMLMDTDQVFSLKTSADDPVRNMQVTGSMENGLLYQCLQFDEQNRTVFEALDAQIKILTESKLDYSQLQAQQMQIIQARNKFYNALYQQHPHALFFAMQRAGQLPAVEDVRLADGSVDYPARRRLMRDHFWDLVDFDDTRLLRTKVIFSKLISYLDELTPPSTGEVTRSIDLLLDRVREKPDYYRFFAVWFAQDYRAPEGPFMDPEAIYIHLVDTYLTRERAFWSDSVQVYAWQLRAEDKWCSLIGQKAQNIEAKDPEGKTRALYDIKSPYIAVFFYHAECEHCQKEAPKLVQFYQEWKSKGVEVYAVAMSTEDGEWKDFIGKYKMDWINVTDQDTPGIYKNYAVPGTPEIYLLNPDRVIIGKHLRTEHLAWMIENDRSKMTSIGQER